MLLCPLFSLATYTYDYVGDGGRVLAAVAEAESAEIARVQAAVGHTMGNDATEMKATLAASASPAADAAAASASPAADAAAGGVSERTQEVAIRVAAAAKAMSRLSGGAKVRKG